MTVPTTSDTHSSKPSLIAETDHPNVLRGDYLLPVMVLKHDAVRHNIELMARYCATHGASLAPHGKTTMAPRLIELQLAAGAWGITAATTGQAQRLRSFGVSTILIANELVEPIAVRWVVGEVASDPSCRIVCLADSMSGVAIMDEAVRSVTSQHQIDVLVEVGFTGGRTGCRTAEHALEVASAIVAAPGLRLAGIECYEGTIAESTLDASLASIDALLTEVRILTEALDARAAFSGAEEIIVSAGGSAFFDRVIARLGHPWRLSLPVRLVLRSGCYITHDSGVYRTLSPFDGRAEGNERFEPALEVWGAVLSLPEPGLAIIGFGKRDVPYDFELPVPEFLRHRDGHMNAAPPGLTVTELNDQHAYARGDCSVLEVGDWLGCGISHPCTAFDKWRNILMVDDKYTVLEVVHTFF